MQSKITHAAILFAQRISLLAVLFTTFAHWAIQISISTSEGLYSAVQTLHYAHPQDVNDTIHRALDHSSHIVLLAALIAAGLTAILYTIDTDRGGKQRALITTLAVLLFCLTVTAFSQLIARGFIGGLAV